ncbi:MAG: hypothetical protein VX899_27140 [Myxococcota bacterium]|nr:hypothetical protein [Myxococcota bacterium]
MLRRFAVALTLGLAAAGTWSLLDAPVAQARSVTPLTQDQMVDASDLVVKGVVSEVWTQLDDQRRIWTLASVEVTRVYKGASTTEQVLVYQKGGSHNGVSMVSSVFVRFSPGEEVLLFLETNSAGKNLVIGGDLGKYTVRIDPDNGDQMLVRATVPQNMYYDHRFLPHPPADQRIYLADVEAEVLDRVAEGWDGQPIPGTSMDRLERINTTQGVTR